MGAYNRSAAVIGRVLERRGQRAEVFLVTKNDITAHGFNSTLEDIERSLAALRTNYIDLYLIHHPDCAYGHQCEGTWRETWRAMEVAHRAGQLRALGVSNFGVDLLRELVVFARIPPDVVQNLHHPLAPDRAVVAFARAHGLAFQSFSTIGGHVGAAQNNLVLTHATVVEIAFAHGRTPAQVRRCQTRDVTMCLCFVAESTHGRRVVCCLGIVDLAAILPGATEGGV